MSLITIVNRSRLLTLGLCCWASMSLGGNVDTSKPVKVFVLSGQSNMEGKATSGTQGYEIAGFIWFQGWNDGVGGGNPEYVEQMAHFIRDIRRDLKAPDLPFVIGELGIDGSDAGGWVATFRKQQADIAAMPEFKDNVRLAKTAHCWHKGPYDMQDTWDAFRRLARANQAKPIDDPTRIDPGAFYQINWEQKYAKELAYTSDKRYHYNGSGRSYYEMGQSMGKAMVELLSR